MLHQIPADDRIEPSHRIGIGVDTIEMPGDPNRSCLRRGLFSNILLVAIKLTAGIVGSSQALLADGINSLLDVVAGGASLFGYRVSLRPPDRNHHFGHHRAESIAALVVGMAILATGGIIIRDAVATLIRGTDHVPTLWTVPVAAAVALLKVGLAAQARRVAKSTGSPSVSALAADHGADVWASTGALIGVSAARLGWPFMDPLAAFWVAGVILMHALRVLRQNMFALSGAAPPEPLTQSIIDSLHSVPGVLGLHRLKVQTSGIRLLVDTEILVSGELSVDQAHAIATQAKDAVKGNHPSVLHVSIHVEPYSARRAAEGADPLRPQDAVTSNVSAAP